MIDTIKPMGMDLTKDLHGHVRVELRDRWTGRVVDSQEKDNLVTNAVQKMLLTAGWSAFGMDATWTPIYQKALGGVFLFDGALTESANNIKFPSNVKLVAYAGQASNTEDAAGGSLNTEESVRTSTGFVTVWDFLTSQANGTIASLARTSYSFNWCPAMNSQNAFDFYLGNAIRSQGSIYSYTRYLGYDSTNHFLYFALSSAVTIDGITYTTNKIYKIKQNFDQIGLVYGMPHPAQWEEVKTLTSSDGTTYGYYFIYDPWANNFVYKNSTTLHVIAMDGTHTTKTLANAFSSEVMVTEGYYWTYYNNNLYRFDKTNTANVQVYPGVWQLIFPMDNDVIFGVGSTSDISGKILYPDGTIVTKAKIGTQSYPQYYYRPMGPFYAYGGTGNGSGIYPNGHYLGTIANLDNPVTKSSSQTMKITYTLTEA